MFSMSTDVHAHVVSSFDAVLRFDGEAVGVLAARGMRMVCVLDGDSCAKGGRRCEGSDDGGAFSAFED